MEVIHTIHDLKKRISSVKQEGKTVGLVPTMGALHTGHITLVQKAREECGFVVVSVFVNPTQFGPNEDFNKYPRTLDDDAEKCREAGVDIVFAPSADEMYQSDYDTWVEVGGVTDTLEGAFRPGHFRGVATVCTKLFNITRADKAYFGRKDYQQLKVIEKLVRELNLWLEIVAVETVREPDGLAMSSRNRYLSPEERKAALILSKSLAMAKELYTSGERNAALISDKVESFIKAEPLANIDYVAVVDANTLQSIEQIDNSAVVLLAVKIGKTRLIDNMVLG